MTRMVAMTLSKALWIVCFVLILGALAAALGIGAMLASFHLLMAIA